MARFPNGRGVRTHFIFPKNQICHNCVTDLGRAVRENHWEISKTLWVWSHRLPESYKIRVWSESSDLGAPFRSTLCCKNIKTSVNSDTSLCWTVTRIQKEFDLVLETWWDRFLKPYKISLSDRSKHEARPIGDQIDFQGSTSIHSVQEVNWELRNARSQFWSVSGFKNNTKKESDPLSAPKCRQEVYRCDILPNWILTAWHFHRSEVEFRFALAIGWNRPIWTV